MPSVLFCTENEVCEQDGDRRGSQCHNSCCESQETKGIIGFRGKQAGHNIVQLNSGGTKGENSTENRGCLRQGELIPFFETSAFHTQGSKYLGFGGICRGIGLTRTGWLTPCKKAG